LNCGAVKPACQSDPDIAAYPKLLPPSLGSTQSRLLFCSMSSRGSLLGDFSWTSCSLLCWPGVHNKPWSPACDGLDAKGVVRKEVRTFGTIPRSSCNCRLAGPKKGVACGHGIDGRVLEAVWNILEDQFEPCW